MGRFPVHLFHFLSACARHEDNEDQDVSRATEALDLATAQWFVMEMRGLSTEPRQSIASVKCGNPKHFREVSQIN